MTQPFDVASPPPAAGVAVASGGRAWELDLIPLLERPRSGLHLVRRCVDLADLLALCRAGLATVAVVSATLPRLDADEVARLRAAGVAVLAVEDADAAGQAVLLGAADAAAATTPPDELVERIRALAGRSVTAALPDHAHAADAHVLGEASADEDPRVDARVIAIWGPTGAPGRSTVAVNLAVERARAGTSVLLVDADPAGGAVSTLLGVLDEAPGLAVACRSAVRGRLDAATLAGHAVAVGDDLRVLTGATRPDRWRELRPTALRSVVAAGRLLADEVIVDLGAGTAAEPSDAFDALPVGPLSVASTVLADSDTVIVVGTADPLGMLRLVHALDQLTQTVPGVSLMTVVNRVRSSVVGPRPGQQVRDALGRFCGPAPLVLLPDDPGAVDRALRRGRPLADAAPDSPLRAALLDLARHLGGSETAPALPRTRRRRVQRRAVGSVG